MLNPSRYGAKTSRVLGPLQPDADEFVYVACSGVDVPPHMYHASHECVEALLWGTGLEVERWLWSELHTANPDVRACTCAVTF